MEKRKPSIPQFKTWKEQGRKIRMATAYDFSFASLVERSPIEMILVGDSLGMVMLGYDSTVPVTMEDMVHHTKPVVRGAANTFIVADMPFGSYNVSLSETMRNANRLLQEGGADAIKLEGGEGVLDLVAALTSGGVPVMGHIGLTPQTASQLGGFKVQGKDAAAAQQLIEDAMGLEEAGAFAVVLECVPAPVAKMISEKLSIPTIGIGAGPDCDGQVLVIHDLLGIFDRFTPKFVKKYAALNGTIIDALSTYAKEVEDGTFPGPEHSFGMVEEELKRLY